MTKPAPLNQTSLGRAVRALSRRDPDLAGVVQRYGPPPLWERAPGFSTLLHIILEQQVSLASAKAAHLKLLAVASPLTPRRFLELDDSTLRGVGFSRQKTRYGRHLSSALVEGTLDLESLEIMDDDSVRQTLIRVKGVGLWTANIYLLMALRRPDIWPTGDLAIAVAAQNVKGLENRPTDKDLLEIASAWRPWRAVAARILWHHYLSSPTSRSRAARAQRDKDTKPASR